MQPTNDSKTKNWATQWCCSGICIYLRNRGAAESCWCNFASNLMAIKRMQTTLQYTNSIWNLFLNLGKTVDSALFLTRITWLYSTEVWNCDHFECGPSHVSARHSSLMVSVLASRLSGLGSSPSWGHCVVFLGKTLYFQCLSPSRCIHGYCRI